MAIVAVEAARNDMVDALTVLVDAGTTNPTGTFEVWTAGFAIKLVDIDVPNPAFGAAAAGVATLNGVPLTGIAVATGTAAVFKMVDRDDAEVYRGTVGIAGSGADAIIDSTSITINDTVQLNSHSITGPA